MVPVHLWLKDTNVFITTSIQVILVEPVFSMAKLK